MEAAEAVCAGNGIERADIFDLMSRLASKSLLSLDEHARYRMLETVRQYAQEKLLESGQERSVRQKHLEYYLSLAEQPPEENIRVIREDWLPRMETEHDNLRAALGWSLESGDTQAGLRLAVRLGYFWIEVRLHEGQDWLQQLLSRSPRPDGDRARALFYLGLIHYFTGKYASALRLFEESLSLFETLGDPVGAADTTFRLAWVHFACAEYSQARVLLERSLKLFQDLNKQGEVAYCLEWMGDLARAEGNLARARQLLEQSEALQRRLEHRIRLFFVLSDLGRLLIHFGELERSEALFKEAKAVIAPWYAPWLGNQDTSMVILLMDFAFLANARGQPVRAVRLLAAFETASKPFGYHIEGPERQDYEDNLASLRSQLDPGAFDAAWAAGQAMTEEEALDYALEEQQAAS